MNKFSILLANKYFFLKGGSETVFFQERDFLLKSGTKVIDFSMEDSQNFLSPHSQYFVSNIDYHKVKGALSKVCLAAKMIHSREAISKLTKLIEKETPDLAHLHNIYHQLTPSIIPLLKKHSVRVLVTLHDGKLICPSYNMLCKGQICVDCGGTSFWKPALKNCDGSRLQGVLLTLEAYWHKWVKSYDHVDRFLVPSRFLSQLVSQRISKDKITVLPNGVDTNKYTPNFDDRGYALYFGRISSEKGIETLLQAHGVFNGKKVLKVVGTGPLMKDLQGRYRDAKFLGYKSGNNLLETIGNSAFVVVPSEWYENCSMVVLEAMAMGKPVIGSRIGGIPEQIEEDETGLLFEPGNVEDLRNKMVFLWDNKKIRKDMGRAARARLENEFSLDEHCSKLLKIYKETLAIN